MVPIEGSGTGTSPSLGTYGKCVAPDPKQFENRTPPGARVYLLTQSVSDQTSWLPRRRIGTLPTMGTRMLRASTLTQDFHWTSSSSDEGTVKYTRGRWDLN